MKPNKRQREKIVKVLKDNDFIRECLIEKEGSMIEDCEDEQDVLENGDYLIISYSADGYVENIIEPSAYFEPGYKEENLTYSIYVDSIQWFVPHDDNDRSLFVDAESIDEINKSLKGLYHKKEYSY